MRPWGQLLRFADGLPLHSRYKAAIHDDIEYAEALAATGALDERPRPPTLAGFTPEVNALLELTDWVKSLYRLTFGVHSQTAPPELPPTRRPRTAFDRLRDKRKLDRHRERVRMMIGE